jgi:hypothetical protein
MRYFDTNLPELLSRNLLTSPCVREKPPKYGFGFFIISFSELHQHIDRNATRGSYHGQSSVGESHSPGSAPLRFRLRLRSFDDSHI